MITKFFYLIHQFCTICKSALNVAKTKGKISAQPHTTLCIQFLDRENNDKTIHYPLENRIVLQWYGAVRKFTQTKNFILTRYTQL